jgi:hypothetical protein
MYKYSMKCCVSFHLQARRAQSLLQLHCREDIYQVPQIMCLQSKSFSKQFVCLLCKSDQLNLSCILGLAKNPFNMPPQLSNGPSNFAFSGPFIPCRIPQK